MKSYLVYLHRRATDGKVFYVGKGANIKRAKNKNARSNWWKRIVEKYGYTVEIYATGLQEWYAFELEKELIAYYGRENLCNMTDGGDGISGMVVSETTKEKIRSKNKGTKPSVNCIKSSIEKCSKKVINSNGEIFNSATEAAKSMIGNGFPLARQSAISNCCNGVVNTAYGYAWKYVEDNEFPKIKERKKQGKKVICSNGMIFNSQEDAATWLRSIGYKNALRSNIGLCCNGKRYKKTYGFSWNFFNEK